jgi:hypothetical protein
MAVNINSIATHKYVVRVGQSDSISRTPDIFSGLATM